MSRHRQHESMFDDEDEVAIEPRRGRSSRTRGRGRMRLRSEDIDVERPRRGAKRSVMHAISNIPKYLRLLMGLMRDSRVSRVDRLLVLGAAAYVIMPLDFVPDLIPFLGQVDDVFLIMAALQRLVDRVDMDVVLDHWVGDPDDISDINLARVVASAGFFLPSGIRRRLRRMARR